MAVNAARSVAINLTGDVILDKIYSAAANALASGSVTIHALVNGANTITVPTVTGITVKGATIVPPSGNTSAITLKGIAGDTGIAISKTDPTSIAFETAPASFVLNAGAAIDGLRIVWT
jgi:hypothetical protein